MRVQLWTTNRRSALQCELLKKTHWTKVQLCHLQLPA